MYEDFIKTSAPRWQKLLQRGRLGAQELGRIEAAGGRAGMSSWGEMLGGAELARHRALEQKLVRPYGAAHNIQPHNFPLIGPATVDGQVYVDPNSGSLLRQFADPAQGLPVRGAAAVALTSPVPWPEVLMSRIRKPQDAGITRAIQRHELGEAGIMRNQLKPNLISSHLGPGPLIAERMGVKDPEVWKTLDQTRAMGREDPAVMKLLRQHGMVGNYVPPLGGRVHRSMERATSKAPASLWESGWKRLALGRGQAPEEIRAIAPHVQNAASRMQALSEAQVPSRLTSMLPTAWQHRLPMVQEPVQRNLRNAAAKLQDNLAQALNQQPTHLKMSPAERQNHVRYLSALYTPLEKTAQTYFGATLKKVPWLVFKPLLQRALLGGAAGSLLRGVHSLWQQRNDSALDWDRVGRQALQGGLYGGVLGGISGGVAGIRRGREFAQTQRDLEAIGTGGSWSLQALDNQSKSVRVATGTPLTTKEIVDREWWGGRPYKTRIDLVGESSRDPFYVYAQGPSTVQGLIYTDQRDFHADRLLRDGHPGYVPGDPQAPVGGPWRRNSSLLGTLTIPIGATPAQRSQMLEEHLTQLHNFGREHSTTGLPVVPLDLSKGVTVSPARLQTYEDTLRKWFRIPKQPGM